MSAEHETTHDSPELADSVVETPIAAADAPSPPEPPEPKKKMGRPKGAKDREPRNKRGEGSKPRRDKAGSRALVLKRLPGIDLVTPVLGARRAPGGRTVIDDALLDDVNRELAHGAWPLELPALLCCPEHRWRGWLQQGQIDAAEGTDTPEAALYGCLSRSKARLEQGYRQALLTLAVEGKNWQSCAWLLSRLSPRNYSDKVLETIEAEVLRLLKVVQESTDPETYGQIVLALEQARADGGG